ncbi:hypothetical protein ACFL2I_03000 [Candidatus Omnitrophota bacterium]
MQKKVRMITIILVVLAVLAFGKNIIAKTTVSAGVRAITGLKLSMRSFNVGIIRTLIGIKGLKLHNPPGFKDKLMADMPEIFVDYNLGAFLKGKVHLNEVRLNLREVTVVKNEKGELNLDALKTVQTQKEGRNARKKEKGKAREIQLDNLELKIGKVIYKDYSRGSPPAVKEFNLNLNEKYTNITDPSSLVNLIVVKALVNTSIAGLADFDLQGLQGTVGDTLASAQKVAARTAVIAKETAQQTQEQAQVIAEEATQKTQQAVKQTTETLKKTTEELKGLFQSPFGVKE